MSSSGLENSPRAARCTRRRDRESGSATGQSASTRWRLASYRSSAAATLTFERADTAGERDRDDRVAGSANQGPHPLAFCAQHQRDTTCEIGTPHRERALGIGRVRPEVGALDLREVAREIRHDRNRKVLDGAGGGSADRRCDPHRAVRGHDDSRRARSLRAPDDRAQVVRVGDLVEADEQRTLLARQRVGVRVPERLAPGDDTLMVARAGSVAEQPLRLDLRSRAGVEPRNLRRGALGRPHLEQLARAAHELPNRSPAVDEVARHRIRTSR